MKRKIIAWAALLFALMFAFGTGLLLLGCASTPAPGNGEPVIYRPAQPIKYPTPNFARRLR